MPEPEFVEGEPLIWSSRNHQDEMVTKRPVSFRGWKNNLVVVAYGLRPDGSGEPFLYSVLPHELARPALHRQLKPVPPPEPAPTIPLEQRRHALRLRFDSFQEAQDAAVSAEQLVNRAQDRVNHTQTQLREYADMEVHHVDSLVHELRHMNGGVVSHSVADNDEEWNNREKVKRDCATAEAALNRFTTELAHTRSIASERQRLVQRAAAHVVAGVLEIQVSQLAELEQQAIELRAQLRAASMLWVADAPLPVGTEANEVLTNFPYDLQDPIGLRVELAEQRQAPFSELFSKLVNGEVDADLPWYDDSDL